MDTSIYQRGAGYSFEKHELPRENVWGHYIASGQTGRAKEYISDCAKKMPRAKSISQNKHSSVSRDVTEF